MPAAASPPESRRHWVLRHLRVIASGDLAPGDRLVERDLSAAYGISRGPVREAIMVLEQEGLVVSHPYAGAVVVDISQEEIAEILVAVRTVIREGSRSARRRVRRTPRSLDALDRTVAAMERAADPLDARRLADLDLEFHGRR